LTASEVVAFASAIATAQRQAGPRGALCSSAHLRLSAIDTSGEREPASPLEFTATAIGEQSLARVWEGVVGRRQLDFEAVEVMVMAVSRTLEDSAAAMLPLAELKSHDDYTVAHVTNVALLTTALAEALGFPAHSLREISLAALLHDVGKLRVPAEVLNQTGRLSDAQRAMIMRHPEDGARILLATPGVPELAVIVAFEHHLHHDGGDGYPQVPKSWTVSLASEMTHIADVFDALRSNRPYRAGMARDRIAAIMGRDAGTVFDPELVDVFLNVVVPRTSESAPAA
jgi:putative nucleotidyltransferase with HDIG domain